MKKLKKKSTVSITIIKNKAYWVFDNILYEAEVHPSGEILSDEATPVDVINMPENKLKQIIKIVDSFNE
jgi:hypothetical protein